MSSTFAIRDSAQKSKDGSDRILGYLFFSDASGRFYTELLPDLSVWDAPPIFLSHVRRKVYSIDSVWTMKWVRQRIIPAERQNIGAVLKAYHLRIYDEYQLLLRSEGRCAQDEEYIEKTTELPTPILDRLHKKVKDVVIRPNGQALVFFIDDMTRVINLHLLLENRAGFRRILSSPEILRSVSVSPFGNGIEWDEARSIPAEELRESGKEIDLSYDDLLSFVQTRCIDTSSLTEQLGVSRQYIHQLVKQDRLHPISFGGNYQLFARTDTETL